MNEVRILDEHEEDLFCIDNDDVSEMIDHVKANLIATRDYDSYGDE